MEDNNIVKAVTIRVVTVSGWTVGGDEIGDSATFDFCEVEKKIAW